MSYSSGDHVYALWKGSGKYYPAKVTRASGDHYTVQFEDGSKDKLTVKEITTETRMRSKSPSRRSRSRSRSRGRSKSPARSKAKAKSSPSPTRKSPSRSKAKTPTSKTPTSKTPTTTPTRQSARIAALELEKEEKRENAVQQQQQQQRKETPKKRSSSKTRQSDVFNKIKGVVLGPGVTLGLIIFMPLFVLAFNVACGKSKCTIKEMPQIPTDVNRYFNLEVVGVFSAFVALQVVLSLMPVGKMITVQTQKGGKRLKRRANALFSVIVTLLIFGVMAYMKLQVTYVYNHFLRFLATSTVFALLLSVFLYIHGRKAPFTERNDAGNTGNFIIDFFHGREVNPRIGNFHFKYFVALNMFFNGAILVNLSMLTHDYLRNGEVNIPAVMVAGFQGLYLLTFLFNEEDMFVSNRDTNDGCGYLFTFWSMICPFFYTFPVRFLVQHPQTWNYYYLAGFGFLNLIGYIIMFGSLLQKSQFRKNPHDPSLAHLDRIPTPNGKGLLAGGWWSLCRKPNYLGDLLQCFCWSFICGCQYAAPYILPSFLLLALIDRQRQDEAECRVKHGAAWDRYCQRVKSRLIPKIY